MVSSLEWTSISKLVAPVIYFFTIYSLFGWLIENIHSYFTKGVFFKKNFYLGPFKPMYGFAPSLLVTFISPDTQWIMVLLLCFVIPTAVEYISGLMLDFFFHQKWWDYSGDKWNFQGHICLKFSFYWLLLSLVCVYVIHPLVEKSFQILTQPLLLAWPFFLLYLFVETFSAVRRHTQHKRITETLG
ncbi:putative ABC transporter permease [Robertmurraya massiliosenegalensis]|uniref:putative ABC transporter permease n=1 Tax=Robertmurraya TaxID=2837507 RepID=UPI0039A4D898